MINEQVIQILPLSTLRRIKFTGIRLCLLASLVLFQACTSEFVVKSMYNKMDDGFADYIKSYADFDEKQENTIDEAASNFAYWHKNTQLPEYARFISETRQVFKSNINEAEMDNVAAQVETFGDAMAVQPWPRLIPLVKSVTPSQIEKIAEKLEEESAQEERELAEELSERDSDKAAEEKLKGARKIFKRALGVKLSAEQLEPFREAIENSIDLDEKEIQLYREWNSKFIGLLQQKASEQKDTALLEHMLSGTRLLREHYPGEVAENRKTFLKALRLSLNSLDDAQRDDMLQRMEQYEKMVRQLYES